MWFLKQWFDYSEALRFGFGKVDIVSNVTKYECVCVFLASEVCE